MNQEPTNAELLKVITEGQKRTDEKIDATQKHTDSCIDEILEVVSDFSTKMDGRMDKLDGRMDKLDGRMDKLDGRMDKLDGRMDKLEKNVTAIKATMVDKDYLDRALANQKGDIILTMRKEDVKLRELITIMHGKQMLTDTEVRHLITMEPFAQLSV